MKKDIIGLAALVIGGTMLSMLITSAASAQAVCGKREDIVKQLEEKYGETRNGMGVQQGRGVVEVYSSAETGSWTILVTNARGMSCLMAAGEAWENEDPKPVGDPA